MMLSGRYVPRYATAGAMSCERVKAFLVSRSGGEAGLSVLKKLFFVEKISGYKPIFEKFIIFALNADMYGNQRSMSAKTNLLAN